jgi:serine/threonine protein kinase
MTRPQPGDRISNYLLDERIAAGSFGEVWKAHHHVFHDTVAVKIPTDSQYVRELQREGTAVHGLRDPHIARALDMDPYADPPYLIMEYVDGPSLRQLIEAHPKGLPVETTVPIVYGVILALEAAHEASVIHRDIKPENILIAGGADLAGMGPSRVKVSDFGLWCAGTNAAQSMLQSGSISSEAHRRLTGTLAYMSPEQRDGGTGDGAIDARSDLYSVGVVLHEMLTGMLPQGSDLPSSIRPDVPRWLDRLFERCYTRRDRRFASAGEMRETVERYWTPGEAPVAAGSQARSEGKDWACPTCSGRIRPQDQYCIHCGRKLVELVPRCPTCHGYVGQADHFCILCGTDLRIRA